jgi:trans-aconitate methyltransferase
MFLMAAEVHATMRAKNPAHGRPAAVWQGDEHMSDPLDRARSISNVDEAARLYAEWAPTYDDDVFGGLGFTGSARIAELLAGALADPTDPVVDLGCGTGAVGQRLSQLGVTTIDGIDLSPEMINVAARTGAYRHLTVGDLNAPPHAPNAAYAASVSAGTFTTGHVGPGAVPGLMKLLRPQGVIAWVIATAVWPRFEPVLAKFGLDVLNQTIESIRRDAPAEGLMFVARLR